MLDYGSFIKDKVSIYTEINSIFSNYNSIYINKLLDEIYSSKYLNDDISVSGWSVFIKHDIVIKIKIRIKEDLKTAEHKLLTVKLLNKNKNCIEDIMRLIAEYKC